MRASWWPATAALKGPDLLVKAFGEASAGVAGCDPDLTHHLSPSMETPTAASGGPPGSRGRGVRAV
jgi:hypothetical protein